VPDAGDRRRNHCGRPGGAGRRALPPLRRAPKQAQARAALPAERFAPFSPLAWAAPEYEGATACLRWPGPRIPDPPVPPGAPYPDVPTLVLNGDLDNITAT